MKKKPINVPVRKFSLYLIIVGNKMVIFVGIVCGEYIKVKERYIDFIVGIVL